MNVGNMMDGVQGLLVAQVLRLVVVLPGIVVGEHGRHIGLLLLLLLLLLQLGLGLEIGCPRQLLGLPSLGPLGRVALLLCLVAVGLGGPVADGGEHVEVEFAGAGLEVGHARAVAAVVLLAAGR